MSEKEIVIVSAARTPFGRFCGSLREYDYFDLGAIPMREVLKRVHLEPDVVDEVFLEKRNIYILIIKGGWPWKENSTYRTLRISVLVRRFWEQEEEGIWRPVFLTSIIC